MDYVGVDPKIGLDCAVCKKVSQWQYSKLLNSIVQSDAIYCHHCERPTNHNWTSLSYINSKIKEIIAANAKQDKILQNT